MYYGHLLESDASIADVLLPTSVEWYLSVGTEGSKTMKVQQQQIRGQNMTLRRESCQI